MTETAVSDEVEYKPCYRHPEALTAVTCSHCGAYLCPRCMIFAPVGVRCKNCARNRRPAQYNVRIDRFFLATATAFIASVIGWAIVLQAWALIWLASIFLGLGVGELASRVAQRRANLTLEIAVGAAIVAGFAVTSALFTHFGAFFFGTGVGSLAAIYVGTMSFSLIPVLLAVLAGVTRLRQ